MTRPPKATDGAAGESSAPSSPSSTHRTSARKSKAEPSLARIIAMLNQKGGVGKTTTTVNLGAAMAEAGKRVCLIDLDPQAHLTFHLGIDPQRIERSVYDLLIDPDCYASDVLINARPNLDVLLSETDLAAAETELASTADRQSILRRKFGTLAEAFDVVIIDCPPSLGLLTLNALSLAKEVFVPMQAHFLALQGVGKLLETVGLVCQSINPELRVTGIILCMHEQQTTLAREIVADLDAFFEEARTQAVPWRDCKVHRPAIRRNVKLAEAPSFGKTIFDYEPGCPGAHDYRMLAKQVLGLADSAPAAAPQSESATPATPKSVEVPRTPVMIESKTAPRSVSASDAPAAWATAAAPVPSGPEVIVPTRTKTAAGAATRQAGL